MLKLFVRCLVCCIFIALSACQSLSTMPDSQGVSQVDLQTIAVKKSPLDTKEYRYLMLDNGLKVLLISDSKAQKASVSLDVNVGSGADPKGREGLAHFLEHMLFLGTKKYPNADAYQSFIQRHGGSYNAYTSYAHTNYFFDIQPAYFEQAFDRFAQFFIAPLFSKDLVERERKAVFSEYAARMKDEGRRSLDALKSVVNQSHPFAKFSVGAEKTLTGDTLRDDVIAFYNTYYSANAMSLVVAANQSLDSLEALVKTEMVKVKAVETPVWQASIPLFEPNALPALLQIKPEKTLRQLKLSFPIASTKPYYRDKPLSYLAHVLGYEGKGSLLSELKRLDLATAISAGGGTSFANESSFVIAIALTQKGEQSWKKVVELVFSVIRRMQLEPLSSELYQDLAKIAELEYRFKDTSSTLNKTMYYASNLHDYAPEDAVAGPYLYKSYQPKLIKQFLADLNPSNMLITLTSKLADTDKTSPWFNAPYQFSPLAKQWVNDLAKTQPIANITTPVANPFLPDDLSINELDNETAMPELIFDQNGVKFWYKQDSLFKKPKTQWVFSLLNNSVGASSASYAANILHAQMLDDAITELSYPALMAGLRFSISAQKRGLSLRLSGYSDKQSQLMNQLLNIVIQGLDDQSRFYALRSELIHYYRNQSQNQPYKIALRAVSDTLLTPSFSPKVIAVALEQLTWQEFKKFNGLFWQNFAVEGLVNGNSSLEAVKAILADTSRFLLTKRSRAPAVVKPIGVTVIANRNPVSVDISSTHKDHAVVLYYQFPKGVNGLALSSVTAKLLETRFYHQLRTIDQLGYVVFATAYNIKQQGGVAFVVQSPKVQPKTLKQSIQAFIDDFTKTYFANKSGEQFSQLKQEFDTVKASLKHELLAPAKNLREQTGRYWYDIVNQQWQFDSREQLLESLDKLSFEQWMDSSALSLQSATPSITVQSAP